MLENSSPSSTISLQATSTRTSCLTEVVGGIVGEGSVKEAAVEEGVVGEAEGVGDSRL